LELARKRFLMEGDDFPGLNYLKYSSPQHALTLSYAHSSHQNPFPSFFRRYFSRRSIEATLTGSDFAHSGKFSSTNFFTLPLRRLFPRSQTLNDSFKHFMLEIEGYSNLNANFRLSGTGFISPLHRHFFSRMRGFANVSSNYPFPEGLGLEGIRNQLSWAGHLKLSMNHFPVFQGSVLKPFWHVTSYATLFNMQRPIHANVNCGVGLTYELGSTARLELLYNFAHWSSQTPRRDLSRSENFQVRLSLND
jgi:hypothetical protein